VNLKIIPQSPPLYPLYTLIPSRFLAESIYRVEQIDGGNGGLRLVEEPLDQILVRDYDGNGEDNPTAWAKAFDLSNWGLFVAMIGDQPVGGITIALDGPVFPARNLQCSDLAVLWDIRVHPDHKGQGIGTMLFQYAAKWARQQGCHQLGLETDSSNVTACKLYARMGCELGGILKYGYSGVPEVASYAMLLWYLDL
jgi:ribosomal protein S18 acetylase RimI-like enzyme